MALDPEALRVLQIIGELFRKGYIKIGVNIEPQRAEKGDGEWNVTQTYVRIREEYIKLEEGNVEIVEGR